MTKTNNIPHGCTIFHNDNGEDYIIITSNPQKDRTLLFRTTETGMPFYVGAWGIREGSWAQGHYFMDDLKGAVDWLYE